MTNDEVLLIRTKVEAVALPLTMLAVAWLISNQEPEMNEVKKRPARARGTDPDFRTGRPRGGGSHMERIA